MHTLVIRRDVLERDPWIARSLYAPFCEAKGRVMAELANPVVLWSTLPWQIAEVEATRALMGDDYWPYGLEANRKTLETLVRYSCEQALAERPVPIESPFVPSTLDAFRI